MKEDFCSFIELIILFFYSSLIQFIVKINNYFNKINYIANSFAIIYKFIIKIIFEFLLKYFYKNNIILFCKINIFLKSNCVIYYRSLLNKILNYFFCNLFFVKCFKDFSKLSFKVVEVYKYYIEIFVIIF